MASINLLEAPTSSAASLLSLILLLHLPIARCRPSVLEIRSIHYRDLVTISLEKPFWRKSKIHRPSASAAPEFRGGDTVSEDRGRFSMQDRDNRVRGRRGVNVFADSHHADCCDRDIDVDFAREGLPVASTFLCKFEVVTWLRLVKTAFVARWRARRDVIASR